MEAQCRFRQSALRPLFAAATFAAGLTAAVPRAGAADFSADIVIVAGDKVTPYAQYWESGTQVRIARLGGDPAQPVTTTIIDRQTHRVLVLDERARTCRLVTDDPEAEKQHNPLHSWECLLEIMRPTPKGTETVDGYECDRILYGGLKDVEATVREIGIETLVQAEGLTPEQREALRKGDLSMFRESGTAERGTTREVWVAKRLRRIIRHVVHAPGGHDTAMEFRNLREGPLDEALFSAPRGYQVVPGHTSPSTDLGATMLSGVADIPPWLHVVDLKAGTEERRECLAGCRVEVAVQGVAPGAATGHLTALDAAGKTLAEQAIRVDQDARQAWRFGGEKGVRTVVLKGTAGQFTAWVRQQPDLSQPGTQGLQQVAAWNAAIARARATQTGGPGRAIQKGLGRLCLEFTLNGRPTSCRVNVGQPGKPHIRDMPYLGSIEADVDPGVYEATLEPLEFPGERAVELRNIRIEEGKTVRQAHDWQAGYLNAAVTRGGQALIALITLTGPDGRKQPCATGMGTWPRVLPPATYRLEVVDPDTGLALPAPTEVRIAAGETAELKVEAPAK